MNRKLFFVGIFISIVFISNAQMVSQGLTGEHQLADWRNFAEQTQVTLRRDPFGNKPNTVGSQFLFNDWVKGKVININGIEFSDGYYNFNKISQNLYVQIKDTVSTVAFLVDKDQLKSISLSDGMQSYQLEKVAGLDAEVFYNVLVKGNKYSLYSETKTKFIPSDFETNGLVTSGNNYDEYKDAVTYWVIFADGKTHEVTLKKKSIKSVFESEKNKVEQFYKTSSILESNEVFLQSLVNFLNQ